ncbi:MAG: hypothetical protein R2705_10835 [Ilumatobacteraceae bacterium]
MTYVEPDDHVDMARAFVELAQSPQRLQSLSDEGYAAYQTYRWEAQAMIHRDRDPQAADPLSEAAGAGQ